MSASIVSLGEGDLFLGFKRTLAATVVAGILQVALGLLRLGKLTFLCPSSVVHGMLAAIGAIIMVKQVPVILGVIPTSGSVTGIISDLPRLIVNADLPVFFIGLLCIAVLVFWNFLPKKVSSMFPGPLMAVIIGLGLSYFIDFEHAHDVNWLDHRNHIGPEFLVHVPESLKDLIIFPLFDRIFSSAGIISILTIFFVGSLESLLSSYAVDKLDPFKRKTDLDKDIISKGVTNICCGLLGAYPIITEIVRSSANIANGAKTKWANFFHGIFMLVFVGLLPGLINHIPLTALAAVLAIVGFNLAHPKHFIQVWHHGKDQFFLFSLTLIVTLVDDLLVGIATGIVAKIILHFIRGVRAREFCNPKVEVEVTSEETVINLKSNAVFLGYLRLQKIVDSHQSDERRIRIEKGSFYTDFTITELLNSYNESDSANKV
jgi:MFS superfamily sulfate permease-like transporter